MSSTIVWFRQDLRLADNPALAAAGRRGTPIIPVFIFDPESEGRWAPGGAARWWMHHSLYELDNQLRGRGSRLIIRQGQTLDTLDELVRQSGADAVFWNRRYEPAARRQDETIARNLKKRGLTVETFNATLLFEPDEVMNKQGEPYRVFTPYYHACLARGEPTAPLPPPHRLPSPQRWPDTLKLAELQLRPTIDWAGGLAEAWKPGETAAQQCLKRFVTRALNDYNEQRERPDLEGTSRLSPYLHWGEISSRQVWSAIRAESGRDAEAFCRQLIWREFAHHLLYHFPRTPTKPLRPEFERFPWTRQRKLLSAWQRGRTGYPLVDAGMRQLWHTGWMHNRVRMVVASFLVKHLLIPWTAGADWFWDTLVDADLANNTFGWQWTAGCGADAAPYFRIFNPVGQAERFDPDGEYVRRWVPELARLPVPWIHRPWEAATALLEKSGVRLGHTYPEPIVEHSEARRLALAAYQQMRNT
ncbi:MAG: deoxyribodipyrimidine photo-lyase [Phycisphaerales bacterium]|nr:deoxyribodipyrimidine photo-lyase [Phycisphaerales bacterium]